MPYRLISDGKSLNAKEENYLLSPKDINTLAIIPELVEAGIDSFKIEGRMKGPEYAAITSYLYRKYLDLYYSLGAEGYKDLIDGEEFREDMLRLMDVYNRGGFSQGYAKSYHGREMMSLKRPNHSGVYVGEVKAVKDGYAQIKLEEKLNAQDVLEIRRASEKLYEFTLKDAHMPGELLKARLPMNLDNSVSQRKATPHKNDTGKAMQAAAVRINAGDEVYRTRNNSLLDYLAEEFINKDAQYPIKGRLLAKIGQPLSLTLERDAISITEYHNIVEQAKNQPLDPDRIKKQLEKTGGSFFFFDELQIEADDNIFIPLAWLNELRRTAITRLEEEIIKSFLRTPSLPVYKAADMAENSTAGRWQAGNNQENAGQSFGIVVSVQTKEQWKTALSYPEIGSVYLNYESFSVADIADMAEQTGREGKSFYLALPHICRKAVYARLERDLRLLADSGNIKGFIVKNFEEISLLKALFSSKEVKKELILNYNMYVYNNEAKGFFNELGISHFTAAVELNSRELKELGVNDSDFMVYAYLPLMTSVQCVFDNLAACIKRRAAEGKLQETEAEERDGALIDRLGKKFYVRAFCKGCYNLIYNGQPLALHKYANEIIALEPRNIRLDFYIETEEQMRRILNIFISRFGGKVSDNNLADSAYDGIDDYTTGHFKRGVL